jgi:hypothetical protein
MDMFIPLRIGVKKWYMMGTRGEILEFDSAICRPVVLCSVDAG